jgi:uncharacterized membrane protein
MAGAKQARSQAAPARGGSTKKSTTKGGRPDAQQPSGGQARRTAGGPAQRANSRQGQQRPAASPSRDDTPGLAEADRPGAPRWLQITTLVLSVAGLGVSIYLTIAHYTSSAILACSDNGLINCAKVTTSPESIVFGVFPVAVLGLAFYVFMVAVNTPWGWRAAGLPVIRWARLGSVIVGIGFVLYLVYTEVITLGNICLWCTSVHVITFLLFGLIVFSAAAGYGVAPAADRRQPRI